MPIFRGALGFRSRSCSNCFSRTVLNEVRSTVYGRSYGSSAPCEVPESSVTRKRVTRDERRAMVKSFVSKYRSTNQGKFPHIKTVQKEVGGDFYVVRTICQELKHKSKAFISRKDSESLSEYQAISSGAKSVQDEASTLDLNNEKHDEHVEPDRGSQVGASSGRDALDIAVKSNTQAENADRVEKQSGQVGGVKIDASESSQGVRKTGKSYENIKTRKRRANTISSNELKIKDLDGNQRNFESSKTSDGQELRKDEADEMSDQSSAVLNRRTKAGSEALPESESPENKTERSQGSTQAEKDSRVISERQAKDSEAAKRPNLWGNLKSFADGILNIWRKW